MRACASSPDMRAPWARSSDVFALSTAAATTLAVPASRAARAPISWSSFSAAAPSPGTAGGREAFTSSPPSARACAWGSSAGEATASAIARRDRACTGLR